MNASTRLVMTAKMEVAVTAWPVIPSVTPRSLAMGVSIPTGRNSAMISPATPSAIETIAFQAGIGASAAAKRESAGTTDRPATQRAR